MLEVVFPTSDHLECGGRTDGDGWVVKARQSITTSGEAVFVGARNRKGAAVSWGTALLAIGVCYSLLLQMWVPSQEVFFSEDGAVKLLQVKSLLRGFPALHFDWPAPSWLQALWRRGLHPAEHAVTISDGRFYSVFPLSWPMLTAPWYAWFGARGLTVVPLLSLWFTWGITWAIVRRKRLAQGRAVALFAGLVFATPLTLYSAIYWEHTTAVALVAVGAAVAMFGTGRPWLQVLAGGCLGASAWLRPEAALICGVLGGVSWFGLGMRHGFYHWLRFVLAAGATASLYVLFNLWLFGLPMGLHGEQVITGRHQLGSLDHYVEQLSVLFFLSVRDLSVMYMVPLLCLRGCARWPVRAGAGWLLLAVALCYGAAVATLGFAERLPIPLRARFVMLLSLITLVCYVARVGLRYPGHITTGIMLGWAVFLLCVPAIAPNSGGYQLGPRYLLVLLPPAVFLAIDLLSRLRSLPVLDGVALAGAFVLLCLGGLAQNLGSNRRELLWAYQSRAAPALRFLAQRPEPVVAVSTGAIALDLAGATKAAPDRPGKAFVRVGEPADLRRVIAAWPADLPQRLLVVRWTPEGPRSGHVPAGSVDLGRHGAHYHFYALSF